MKIPKGGFYDFYESIYDFYDFYDSIYDFYGFYDFYDFSSIFSP